MNIQCPSSHCGHQRTGQDGAAIWDSLVHAIPNFQESLQRGVDLSSLPHFLSVPWGCSGILIIYGHLHLRCPWASPSLTTMNTSISRAREHLHLQSPWALPSNSWLHVHAASGRVQQLSPDLPEVLPASDWPSPASRKIEREIWMFYQRKNKPGWALRCTHREVLPQTDLIWDWEVPWHCQYTPFHQMLYNFVAFLKLPSHSFVPGR